MLKRLLSLTLVFLLFYVANAAPIATSARAGQGKLSIDKVKADVVKRAGKKSRVTVKLQDGTKLKGNISQAGEDSFTLTDSKTGQSRTLAYTEVAQVKGQGLSTLAKVAIITGIGLGVLIIVVAIGIATFDLGDGPIVGGL
jgi:hypothetical protein